MTIGYNYEIILKEREMILKTFMRMIKLSLIINKVQKIHIHR